MPPHTRLDPKGYYARLGLQPPATRAEIVSAFRGKARLLHPDVPSTGNAEAFVALKQAYDELSDSTLRDAYDLAAREALSDTVEPKAAVVRRTASSPASVAGRQGRLLNPWLLLWGGLAALLCLGVYQAALHLLAAPLSVRAEIRPNAATVEPLSPGAHQAMLYGPLPVRFAGTPNFYVTPAASPAVLRFLDARRNVYVSLGTIPPFSVVHAVRLIQQTGMLEVLLNDRGNGFISADHLTPGNADEARQAYCGYNAGMTPYDGELLQTNGHGNRTLEIENRTVQPTVVKLRDDTGAVALSVFLMSGGRAAYGGLPDGTYHAEFAVGEIWSRACNTFAVGTRARRIDAALRLPGDTRLVVAPDAGIPASSDISNQAFERD
jgi:hypothetical protein